MKINRRSGLSPNGVTIVPVAKSSALTDLIASMTVALHLSRSAITESCVVYIASSF